MLKTPNTKYILPELTVSEKNAHFVQKSRFLLLALQNIHPSKVSFVLLTLRILRVLEPHRIPGGGAIPLLSHNSLDLGT